MKLALATLAFLMAQAFVAEALFSEPCTSGSMVCGEDMLKQILKNIFSRKDKRGLGGSFISDFVQGVGQATKEQLDVLINAIQLMKEAKEWKENIPNYRIKRAPLINLENMTPDAIKDMVDLYLALKEHGNQ